MQAESRAAASGNVLRLFKRRGVALGMAGCGAFFMGQFALFTYVRPFLEGVTHVSVSALSLVLLTVGVAGFIGTTLIGTFLKRGLYRTLISIPLLLVAAFLTFLASRSGIARAA